MLKIIDIQDGHASAHIPIYRVINSDNIPRYAYLRVKCLPAVADVRLAYPIVAILFRRAIDRCNALLAQWRGIDTRVIYTRLADWAVCRITASTRPVYAKSALTYISERTVARRDTGPFTCYMIALVLRTALCCARPIPSELTPPCPGGWPCRP